MPGNFVFVAVNQYCRKKPRCIITMHLGFFFVSNRTCSTYETFG